MTVTTRPVPGAVGSADEQWDQLAQGHYDDSSAEERFEALLQAALASRRAALARRTG